MKSPSNNQFGDWYLAHGRPYDWGPGQHSAPRQPARGYADYWELYRRGGMPAENPRVRPPDPRCRHHGQEPRKKYGLDKKWCSIHPCSTTLSRPTYAIDMKLVADVTDTTVANNRRAQPRTAPPHDTARTSNTTCTSRKATRDQFNQAPQGHPRRQGAPNWALPHRAHRRDNRTPSPHRSTRVLPNSQRSMKVTRSQAACSGR